MLAWRQPKQEGGGRSRSRGFVHKCSMAEHPFYVLLASSHGGYFRASVGGSRIFEQIPLPPSFFSLLPGFFKVFLK